MTQWFRVGIEDPVREGWYEIDGIGRGTWRALWSLGSWRSDCAASLPRAAWGDRWRGLWHDADTRPEPICSVCGRRGHAAYDCPWGRSAPQ